MFIFCWFIWRGRFSSRGQKLCGILFSALKDWRKCAQVQKIPSTQGFKAKCEFSVQFPVQCFLAGKLFFAENWISLQKLLRLRALNEAPLQTPDSTPTVLELTGQLKLISWVLHTKLRICFCCFCWWWLRWIMYNSSCVCVSLCLCVTKILTSTLTIMLSVHQSFPTWQSNDEDQKLLFIGIKIRYWRVHKVGTSQILWLGGQC